MSNDKQTAEEAAREWAENRPKLVLSVDYFHEHLADEQMVAFMAGVRWAQEREKVLGEEWVIVNGSNFDRYIMRTNSLTEEGAWGTITCSTYSKEAFMEMGYRAVKVKLVEVEE